MNYSKIGANIRELRRSQKITQEKLAEKANLSVRYISNIEKSDKHISLETLIKLASALNVTADRILRGNQENDLCGLESELNELMGDCTIHERNIIIDTAKALKKIIRENSDVRL
ncbi:MAG: helix-turn-helix domain-containing protein [Oscillospiraceae bacterium]|nr:helix-turn-helix domain-containing protein [Oscillospiraceae bacterium]